MKTFIAALSLALLCAGASIPTDADAKRMGGGKSSGMQRSAPADRATPSNTPAQQPAPAAAPTTAGANPGAAAAAPKRSWMGPLAGLAAGLGLAALMSHMGLGGEFGNLLTMLLVAGVGFVLIRFLMKRFARPQNQLVTPQGVQVPLDNTPADAPQMAKTANSPWPQAAALTPVTTTPAVTTPAVPAGFDAAGFEQAAKLIFIRMQAANDRADLNDLRNFTTPEMFASIKLDLQERNNNTQLTDVVKVDAQVLEVSSDAQHQIVSVRFHGLIREEANAAPEAFDEIWHLTKPLDNTAANAWAIAGIQQQGR
jgi:predicted lipid-binding transport protein (Tim44 family)